MKLKTPWNGKGKPLRSSQSTKKVSAAPAVEKKRQDVVVGQRNVVEAPIVPLVDGDALADESECDDRLAKLAYLDLSDSGSHDDHPASTLGTGTTVSLISASIAESVGATTQDGPRSCAERAAVLSTKPNVCPVREDELPTGMPREIRFKGGQDHEARHEAEANPFTLCGVIHSSCPFFFADPADPDDFFLDVRFPELSEEKLKQLALIGKRIYMKHSEGERGQSLTLIPSEIYVQVAPYDALPDLSIALETVLRARFSGNAPRDAALILQARVILFRDGTSFKDLFNSDTIPDRMELAVAWSLSTKVDGLVYEGGMEVEIVNASDTKKPKGMERSILASAALKIANRIQNADNGVTLLLKNNNT